MDKHRDGRGGATTLIYRCFYPNDVDASVPYGVTNAQSDIEDKRRYAFWDTTAGDASCVKRSVNVRDSFCFQHEKKLLQKIPAAERSLHYTFLGGLGQAFEYTVFGISLFFLAGRLVQRKGHPVTNNNL